MKVSPKRVALFVLVAVVVVGWCGFLVYRGATQTKTTTYRIIYKSMPADDRAFAEWLEAQPGVVTSAVDRDGDTLVAVFVMRVRSRDPEPPVVSVGEKFGYGVWAGTSSVTELSPLFPW